MKYSVKVNEVRAKEGSNIKGFATVVFGDSFKITNIAILENKDKGELFVSMPRYRSNERDESNGVIYKDVCNPITAEFREELYAMDMNKDYGDGANPVILKSEFIMSLCEQLIGGTNLGAKQKSIIDRCTASVYRSYQQNDYQGHIPTLQDFRAELLQQDEPEAKELALAIELFTHGSLNTFAKQTNER